MAEKLFQLLDNIPNEASQEIFQTIVSNENVKIERIVSHGQTTQESYWYDQKDDELVVLIKGKAVIQYDDGQEFELKEGSLLYIPANQKHKVIYTSNPAVWLAVFIYKG